jgi:hypothetical protein
LGGEQGAPEGEDLGALVDALETFLGFGNRSDRGDPELLEAKIVTACRRFEEAVRLCGREKIDDRLEPTVMGFSRVS